MGSSAAAVCLMVLLLILLSPVNAQNKTASEDDQQPPARDPSRRPNSKPESVTVVDGEGLRQFFQPLLRAFTARKPSFRVSDDDLNQVLKPLMDTLADGKPVELTKDGAVRLLKPLTDKISGGANSKFNMTDFILNNGSAPELMNLTEAVVSNAMAQKETTNILDMVTGAVQKAQNGVPSGSVVKKTVEEPESAQAEPVDVHKLFSSLSSNDKVDLPFSMGNRKLKLQCQVVDSASRPMAFPDQASFVAMEHIPAFVRDFRAALNRTVEHEVSKFKEAHAAKAIEGSNVEEEEDEPNFATSISFNTFMIICFPFLGYILSTEFRL